MTHPITTISDKEINDKIKDVIFELREEGITKDGDDVHNMDVIQFQYLVVRLVRECITLGRLNLAREKCIEHRGKQLEDINDALNIIGASFKLIKSTLKNEYEGE